MEGKRQINEGEKLERTIKRKGEKTTRVVLQVVEDREANLLQ